MLLAITLIATLLHPSRVVCAPKSRDRVFAAHPAAQQYYFWNEITKELQWEGELRAHHRSSVLNAASPGPAAPCSVIAIGPSPIQNSSGEQPQESWIHILQLMNDLSYVACTRALFRTRLIIIGTKFVPSRGTQDATSLHAET